MTRLLTRLNEKNIKHGNHPEKKKRKGEKRQNCCLSGHSEGQRPPNRNIEMQTSSATRAFIFIHRLVEPHQCPIAVGKLTPLSSSSPGPRAPRMMTPGDFSSQGGKIASANCVSERSTSSTERHLRCPGRKTASMFPGDLGQSAPWHKMAGPRRLARRNDRLQRVHAPPWGQLDESASGDVFFRHILAPNRFAPSPGDVHLEDASESSDLSGGSSSWSIVVWTDREVQGALVPD